MCIISFFSQRNEIGLFVDPTQEYPAQVYFIVLHRKCAKIQVPTWMFDHFVCWSFVFPVCVCVWKEGGGRSRASDKRAFPFVSCMSVKLGYKYFLATWKLSLVNTAFKLTVCFTEDTQLSFDAQILQAQLKTTVKWRVLLGTHCCKYACITDDSKV